MLAEQPTAERPMLPGSTLEHAYLCWKERQTCADDIDNDCDGLLDCSDRSCSGIGACPECGEVVTTLGMPLPLPDGVGDALCSSDMDCNANERCFEFADGFGATFRECRESYSSAANLVGATSRIEAVSDIVSVCVTMEHSWMGDLQFELQAPDGRLFQLQRFEGRSGDEVVLGEHDDCDNAGTPEPGVGGLYCWTPTATRPSMIDHANAGDLPTVVNCNDEVTDQLPTGDYSASDDWTALIGAPIGGEWSLLVTDLWPIDNGHIFEWSITFDAATFACGGSEG